MNLKKNITIVFLGPDGSGKTTMIKILQKKLNREKLNYKLFHLKPDFYKSKTNIVKNPHNQVPRSKLLSFVKLFYWLIIYRLFFLINFFKKNNLVIFDRYAHDVLIDPIRYRYSLNNNLSELILKFFPKPDLWIFMMNKPEIVWKRKKEVQLHILKDQLKKYLNFKKKYKNSIICSQKKDIRKIQKYINSQLYKKSYEK